MRHVQLRGMGWLGSLLAWRLHAEGVPFSWNDTRSGVTAWPVSTGMVYPCGDAVGEPNHARWLSWAAAPPWGAAVPREATAPAAWWYSSKAPPHNAKGRSEIDLGPLRLAPVSAVAVDVPTVVQATRAAFAAMEATPRPESVQVVAHGFGERLTRYVWGWARRVRLGFAPEVLRASRGRVPAVYARQGRFLMAYAYPIGGTGWWWAGSSLIVQTTPRRLEVAAKYERWRGAFLKLTGGLVTILEEGEAGQGWRPRGDDNPSSIVRDGWVHLPSLWHSGVRWAPSVMDSALACIREVAR